MPVRVWSLDNVVAILDVSGRLDAETGAALHRTLDTTLRAGQRQLLLNRLFQTFSTEAEAIASFDRVSDTA